MPHSSEVFTDDAIFNGKVLIRQRAGGYRFSIDALLLAWYSWALPGERMLELGAGNGVVSLALAYKRPDLRIDAGEIQEGLAELARSNVKSNSLNSITVFQEDLKNLSGSKWEGKYNLVVSNPPYRAMGRGRLNPDPEKARARHELLCTLGDVVSTSERTLAPGGSVALILLAERSKDLEKAVELSDLAITHRLRIHTYEDKPPILLLTRLQKTKPTDAAEGRLVIYEALHRYTSDVRSILNGEWEKVPHPLLKL